MFFGLLKRNYEDSSYNQRFYYSDIKLAFMTLWSCLNDIQFIYYDKSDTWTNNGIIRDKIYIEKYIIDKLGLSTPCCLQDRNGSSNNFVTPLKADYKSTGLIYEILVKPIDLNTKNGYAGSIGEQIAFLLLKFAESPTIIDTTSGAIDSNILSNRLVHLKDKRNHLYLTHGNEESASTFFTQLEEENKEINLIDCADLFNIVFFLLKGEYIQINISSP